MGVAVECRSSSRWVAEAGARVAAHGVAAGLAGEAEGLADSAAVAASRVVAGVPHGKGRSQQRSGARFACSPVTQETQRHRDTVMHLLRCSRDFYVSPNSRVADASRRPSANSEFR